jgi:hypothetical protein
MATLAQLQSEPWWGREIATSPMAGLGLQLRGEYGTGALSVGVKGNVSHLSGGHRSQEWIKNSAYCTNRNYATQSGLTAEQLRYNAAIDFTPGEWGTADNRAKMRVLTKRVIDAMKAGRCDEALEVFGTLDGKNVTGWRNDLNVVVTADSTHLDHIHIRFDRRYANDNAVMSKMAAILLEDDMPTPEEYAAAVWKYNAASSANPVSAIARLNQAAASAATAAARTPADLDAQLDAILAAALDDGDTTVVLPPEGIAALEEIKASIAAVPEAVLDAEAARLTE